ncbi:UDP-3-O-(3-hydroxymyristoyl)-glucosamine N-acyltransferase [Klebsiella pneumoniae]|nr:UDP-3-O-(3-hydroxymyristoyl)-glucosamine N-acyltransferase [Klebsiella pneumoniae]
MLTIRQACPEDAPQLSAMGYASYHHHFAHLWRAADELALFLKQEYAEDALRRSLADATQHWLIAEAPSPVGFAKYSYQQRMADDGKIGTLLHKLYLMPGKTGHRYGEHIFHAVETRAKTAGESWLWLEVLAANPAARRFLRTPGDAAHQRHDFPLRQPAKHLTYSGQTDLRGTMPELRDTGVRNVVCGENVVIYQPANLYDCQLGDNVFVGPFVEIQGNTRIGANSKIQSHTFICEYVTIGQRCFIGHGVMFANDLFREGKPNADRASWGRIEIGDDVSIAAAPRFWPSASAMGW